MKAGAVKLRGLSGHDPGSYVAHMLHRAPRAYLESNCYADVLIELLHAHGHEPLAMFGHLLRMDFEGDQWTFFKPPADELERLFGVDIHEMQPYRALADQMAEQLELGRTMIVELDSWFLPDTAATSYHAAHVKSSVGVDAVDRSAEVLHYFHGLGLHALHGPDFRGVLRLDGAPPVVLPPYTELVRFDAGDALEGDRLRATASDLLAAHAARRPATNPFERFGDQLGRVLPELLDGDLGFHDYAFATVRMAGSAFEIAGDHVRWLFGPDAPGVAELTSIVDGCKTLSFRLARRRAFDPEPAVAQLATAWEGAMLAIDGAL